MELEFSIEPNGRMKVSEESRAHLRSVTTFDRYAAYHKVCQDAYQKAETKGSVAAEPDLVSNGIQIVRGLLSPSDISALRGFLDERIMGPDENPDGSLGTGAALPWNMARMATMRSQLDRIFASDLDGVLKTYFGAYYRILSLSVSRRFPGQAPDTFFWHRDGSPPQQTHLIIYLTEATKDGGSISFLDLEDTRAAAKAGYHFPFVRDRISDLAVVERKLGRRLNVIEPDLRPADGVIFGGPRVLHRGNLPKTGIRDTLTILLQPSPVPWDVYLGAKTNAICHQQHKLCLYTEPFEDVPHKDPTFQVPDWFVDTQMFPTQAKAT